MKPGKPSSGKSSVNTRRYMRANLVFAERICSVASSHNCSVEIGVSRYLSGGARFGAKVSACPVAFGWQQLAPTILKQPHDVIRSGAS